MEICVNLSDTEIAISDSDIEDMWNIITDTAEDFMADASNFIIGKLEDDFGYYFPYVEVLYNKIKELKEENNG